MRKESYYHPLSILPETDYIADFVLNCYEFIFVPFFVAFYNIPDSSIGEYSPMSISNSSDDKYYVI